MKNKLKNPPCAKCGCDCGGRRYRQCGSYRYWFSKTWADVTGSIRYGGM